MILLLCRTLRGALSGVLLLSGLQSLWYFGGGGALFVYLCATIFAAGWEVCVDVEIVLEKRCAKTLGNELGGVDLYRHGIIGRMERNEKESQI